MSDVEKIIDEFFNSDEHKKLFKESSNELWETGILIIKKEGDKTIVVKAGTEEWFDILEKIRNEKYKLNNQ